MVYKNGSGTFLEQSWDYVYKDLFREDDYAFMVLGTSIWMFIVFYGLCAVISFVDLTGTPKWMLRFKTQPGANEPIDRKKLLRAYKLATFNQVVVSGPWLILVYYLHRYMGSSCRTEDLPPFSIVVRDLTVCVLVQEVLFYYLHRLFHWGPLYRHVHKVHHEWQAPAGGIVSVAAHPLEHLLVNLPQFTLGPVLMGAHRFTTLLWYTRSIIDGMVTHSGYHLPFTMSPEFHDYHHLTFTGNYGGYGWLDWLHGTDKNYRRSVQHKRHQVLFSHRPLTEQHPDTRKTCKIN